MLQSFNLSPHSNSPQVNHHVGQIPKKTLRPKGHYLQFPSVCWHLLNGTPQQNWRSSGFISSPAQKSSSKNGNLSSDPQPQGSQHTKPKEEDHQLQVVANSTMKATNKDKPIPMVAACAKGGSADGQFRIFWGKKSQKK